MNNIFNMQCPSMNQHNQYNDFFDAKEGFMLGNLFKNLYMSYHGFSNYFFQSDNERHALLSQYQMYMFAAHELNLYLDTHPKDQNTLHLYYEFIKKKNEAKKLYENKYGPLTVSYISNSQYFEWVKGPWPWECQ